MIDSVFLEEPEEVDQVEKDSAHLEDREMRAGRGKSGVDFLAHVVKEVLVFQTDFYQRSAYRLKVIFCQKVCFIFLFLDWVLPQK